MSTAAYSVIWTRWYICNMGNAILPHTLAVFAVGINITGDHTNQDLWSTQKPIYYTIFTNPIWSWLLRTTVIACSQRSRLYNYCACSTLYQRSTKKSSQTKQEKLQQMTAKYSSSSTRMENISLLWHSSITPGIPIKVSLNLWTWPFDFFVRNQCVPEGRRHSWLTLAPVAPTPQ